MNNTDNSSTDNVSEKNKTIQMRVSQSEKDYIDSLLQKFKRKLTRTDLIWLGIDLIAQQIQDKKNGSVDEFEIKERAVHIARVDIEKIERMFDTIIDRLDNVDNQD